VKTTLLAQPKATTATPPSAPDHARFSGADVVAMMLLTLLAAALRFYGLGKWGFYFDEFYTVDDALNMRWGSVYGIPMATFPNDAHTASIPITFLLTRLAFILFGVSEWSARCMSALAGVAAVPLFYLFFTRISSRTLGWLGALLIAVAPWHIYHSQEARFYALLFLFGGGAAFSLYLGLERDGKWSLFLSTVFLTLALLTQTAAVFLAVALFAYLLILWVFPCEKPPGLRWRTFKWFVVPFMVEGLLMSPFALYVLQHWGMKQEDYKYSPAHIMQALIYNFGAPLIALAGFGLLESLRRRERLGLFLAMYGGIPLLLLLTATFLLKSAMGPRYLLGALPAYFLLAAYGGVLILRQVGGKSPLLAAGLVALMLTAQLPFLMSYYVDGDRADYRYAANFLSSQMGPSDVVLSPHSPYTLKYYLQRHVELLNVSESELRHIEQTPQVKRWLVVVVGRHSFVNDGEETLERWLQKHGQLVYEHRSGQFDLHTHDIRVYKL
jgi:hypothetical protein